MRRIVIINPNSNPATTERLVRVARQHAPTWAIRGITSPDGPSMIVNETQLAHAANSVIRMGQGISDADAVVVGAFGDPGTEHLRRILPVPVVGLAQASFAKAREHGRFAVATTTPQLRAAISARVQVLGYASVYTGTFLTDDSDPVSLTDTPDRLAAQLSAAVHAATAAGARAVCIGGGPLAGLASRIACDVPLIDPVAAAVCLLTDEGSRARL